MKLARHLVLLLILAAVDPAARAQESVPGPAEDRNSQEAAVVPGPPSRLELVAEPAVFTAGSGSPVHLLLRIVDDAGKPVAGVISISADLGKVGSARSTEPGTYECDWTLPDSFGGRVDARVQALLGDATGPEVRAESMVALQGAPAAKLNWEGPADPIPADGNTSVTLRLTVQDPFGNVVRGVPIQVSATAGSAAVRVADGLTLVDYQPPLLHRPGRVTLQATSGQLNAEIELALLGKEYTLLVGPMVGYWTNFGAVSTIFASIEVAVALPFLYRGLLTALECGTYTSSSSDTVTGASSNLVVVPLTLSLTYRFAVSERVQMSIGAGAGAYFVSSDVTNPDKTGATHKPTAFGGFGTLAGWYALGPGRVGLLLRYTYANAAGLGDVNENLHGLSLLLSYQFGVF